MMSTGDKGWADAHSHLADPRILDPDAAIIEAKAQGIEMFLQGGVGPGDWERQKALAARHPGVLPVFGLHPYWIRDHSADECEEALDQLARELPKAAALGETGLDFRPHILQDAEIRQLDCFQAQLEMARVAKKPVVLHIVQAFPEALRILDFFGSGTRGLVHAFTGSWEQAEAYLKRGYLISIGGPVCRDNAIRLHEAVRRLPLDKLLIETDSPDQPPPGVPPGHNRPVTLLKVAAKVGELKGLSATQILDNSGRNLRELLHVGAY